MPTGLLSSFGRKALNLMLTRFRQAAKSNNGMHPTRDTLLVMYLQRLGRAGDA